MASTKQIEANRSNSKLSTGPTTEEGKAVSRGNSLTHGLSGNGIVLTPDVEAEVNSRLVEWKDELPSETPRQRWLAEQTVVESVRIERCQRQFFRLCRDHAERAGHSWEEDRQLDAQILFARIKEAPERTSLELHGTRHGCERLIEAWRCLGQALDDQGDWNEEQHQDALDLLGHPRGYRQGRTLVDPVNVPDRSTFRREFVLAKLEMLKERLENGLNRSDRTARSIASGGAIGAELTTPVRTTLRLETACHRRYKSALKELDSLQTIPQTADFLDVPDPFLDGLPDDLDQDEEPEPEPEPDQESGPVSMLRPEAFSIHARDAEGVLFEPFTEALARRLESTSADHAHPAGNRHDRRAAEAANRHC